MSLENKISLWKNFSKIDEDLKQELFAMNDAELADAFTDDLAFGTGGLRGILGAGTNRMNTYIVSKATLGFGKYLSQFENAYEKGIAIAHDNRHKSKEFALQSAKVLTSLGYKVYLFSDLRPTPELSYAVRYFKAIGGIMVTASHNPKEYNGYKIYDENGCQLIPSMADQVIAEIEKVEDYFNIEDKQNLEKIIYVDKEVDDSYIARVKEIVLNKDQEKNVKMVYTPLHGTGSVFAADVLKQVGYDVNPLAIQMTNDPDFSAVKSSNPENHEAYDEAIEYADEIGGTVVLATDPDGDRLGCVVKHKGEWIYLTGNETGALVLNYIIKTRKELKIMPENPYLFTTIVSGSMPKAIAKKHGVAVDTVLTGFKFIGDKAEELSKSKKGTYLFGFEESYGFLVSDFVRDKDSIQAILIIAEAACYYDNKGMDLYDGLESLYEEYGFYKEGITNIVLKGLEGKVKIASTLDFFRKNEINLPSFKIVVKEDYTEHTGYNYLTKESYEVTLPTSNVIKYTLNDNMWFVLRPSGTEPKLKVYYGVKGVTEKEALDKLALLEKEILDIVNKLV